MKRAPGVALVVVAAVAAAAWAARDSLAEWALTRAARVAGFPEARLAVTALDTRRLRLEAVHLASGLTARAVTVRFSLAGLWHGRLGAVTVHGLDARVERAGEGWRVPGLGRIAGGGAAPPVRPAAVRCVACRATVAGPGGRVRVRAAGVWTPETVRLDARLRLREGRVRGLLAGARGRAVVHAVRADGRWRVRTAGPVTLSAAPRGRPARRLSGDRVRARLADPAGGGVRLSVGRQGAAWRVAGALRAVAAAGDRRVTAETAGHVSLWGDGVPRHLGLDHLTLTVAGVDPPGTRGTRLRLHTGALDGAPPVLETPLTVSARAGHVARGAVTARDARLAAHGTLRLDGRRLAFRPAAPVRLRAARLALGDRLAVTDGAATVRAKGALARAALAADGTVTARLDGRLVAPGVRGHVRGVPEGPLPFRAAVPGASGTLDWNGRRLRWTLDATGGRLAVPRHDLRATGVRVRAGPDGWSARARRVTVPPLAPLRVRAAGPLAADRATLRAYPAARPETRLATVKARRTADGAVLDIDTPELRLGPQGVLAEHLVPAAEGRLALDGRARVEGRVRLPSGDADLGVRLSGMDVAVGPMVVEKVNGVVRLVDLRPLTTPGGQALAAARLRGAGPPARDLRLRFHLPGDGGLVVEHAGAALAGGDLVVRRVRLTPGRLEKVAIPVEVTGVAIQRLVEMSPLEDLTVEGELAGTVPLVVEDGRLRMKSGVLTAMDKGWLRFRPDRTPAALRSAGKSGILIMRALENFRYDSLRLTLGGTLGESVVLGIHLEGANPDLYDGRPVRFNLTVDGPLMALVRSGLATYRVPERIRQGLRRFGEE